MISSQLPFALRLGRATLANIRQNVAIALGLKLAFVVLAALGLATLWMAIVADTGASLLVTANSLRLLQTQIVGLVGPVGPEGLVRG